MAVSWLLCVDGIYESIVVVRSGVCKFITGKW